MRPQPTRGRTAAVLVAVAAAVLGLTACGSTPVVGSATPAEPVPVAPAASAPARPPVVVTPAPAPSAPPLSASAPEHLTIPSIGVSAGPLMSLGIDRAGGLEVPPDATTVGWFELGPTPGERGPAVVAAHVDYAGVPGAFTRLHDVAEGDEVTVRRRDGTSAVFTAYRVDRYEKSAFPTEQVYGDTDGAELRLITCGGDFDRGSGQYRDNVVVYARLTRT